jgi:hypothetical protein
MQIHSHNGNGNGTRIVVGDDEHEHARAKSGQVLTRLSEVARIPVWRQRDAFDDGYALAVKEGLTEPRDTHLVALEEDHRAAAREVFTEEFDPASREGDRLRDDEFKKLLGDRRAGEESERQGATDVLERERDEAETPAAGEPPRASQALVVAGAVVVAMTLTLTMRDSIFFLVPDDMLRWFCAVLTAATFGLLITHGIVSHIESAGRTMKNRVALAGGVVIAIGLAAFRFKDAHGWDEFTFCSALLLIELGTMIFLDAYASALRRDHQEWAVCASVKAKALAVLEAARAYHARCTERLAELNDAVGDHIAYVEKRHSRRHHIKEIEEALVSAGRDGYFHGLAENKGRRLGVRSKRHEDHHA